MMPKSSHESTDAMTAVAGYLTIHLFSKLIDKGLLSGQDGKSILKQAHSDVAGVLRDRKLDLTLMEADEIIAGLYEKLG
jgi:hypothetical protein